MFSGHRNAHTSPAPQDAAPLGFVPSTGSSSNSSSKGVGFGSVSATSSLPFGSTASAPASFSGGFRFGGETPSSRPLFATPSAGKEATSSLFGPSTTTAAAPTTSSLFWRPPVAPAQASPFTPAVAGRPFDASDKSNPLGRGTTTRECFAVNDDQRFTKPAFQSNKASPWAAIVNSSFRTPPTGVYVPANKSALFGGDGTSTVWGGTRANATTRTSPFTGSPPVYAPTPVAEARGETVQFVSISAMPAHGDRSVEELRLSTRDNVRVAPAVATMCHWPPATSTAFDLSVWTGVNPFRTATFDPVSTDPVPRVDGTSGTSVSHGNQANPFQTPSHVSGNPTTVLPSDPFRTKPESSVSSSGNPIAPFTWDCGRPKEAPTTPTWSFLTAGDATALTTATDSGFRLGGKETAAVSTSTPSEPGALFLFLTPRHDDNTDTTATTVTAKTEKKAGPTDETLAPADAAGNPLSLALPRLTPSYSGISGSRAKAFLRRADVVGSKGFGSQKARLVVAAMLSPRKFTAECSSSPLKKPLERTVVGRRDAEVWKRSERQFKTSLFATSAHTTALALVAATQEATDKPVEGHIAEEPADEGAVEEETRASDVEVATEPLVDVKTFSVPSGSIDLDDYDL